MDRPSCLTAPHASELISRDLPGPLSWPAYLEVMTAWIQETRAHSVGLPARVSPDLRLQQRSRLPLQLSPFVQLPIQPSSTQHVSRERQARCRQLRAPGLFLEAHALPLQEPFRRTRPLSRRDRHCSPHQALVRPSPGLMQLHESSARELARRRADALAFLLAYSRLAGSSVCSSPA